jgi:hypothetical protein
MLTIKYEHIFSSFLCSLSLVFFIYICASKRSLVFFSSYPSNDIFLCIFFYFYYGCCSLFFSLTFTYTYTMSCLFNCNLYEQDKSFAFLFYNVSYLSFHEFFFSGLQSTTLTHNKLLSQIIHVYDYLTKINLFDNEKTLSLIDEILATRLFIFLLITTLIIIINFTTFSVQTHIVTIESPSYTIFDQLSLQYPITLSCPCKIGTIRNFLIGIDRARRLLLGTSEIRIGTHI